MAELLRSAPPYQRLRRLLPGLLLTGFLTVVAYGLAHLPGLRIVGALGVALLLGLAWRALWGLPAAATAGAAFSARTLLRVGVILLGVRLNFILLYQAGPAVLLLALLIALLGLVVIERLGKWLGMSRGLRLTVALGSSICGASAIAAAAPVVKARDEEISVAVGIISLLGTLGVLGYTLFAPILQLSVRSYGLMTGSTLHEVAHVLAAGAAQGVEALDLAILTKLTRVALLAPVLLGVSAFLSHRDEKNALAATAKPSALVPGFLIGFLLVGTANSLGFIPALWVNYMQTASLILIASSMAAIGLGVDFAVVKRIGGSAAFVGFLGFVLLVSAAALYVAFSPV